MLLPRPLVQFLPWIATGSLMALAWVGWKLRRAWEGLRAAQRAVRLERALREFGDLMRDADRPEAHAHELLRDLSGLAGRPVAALLRPASGAQDVVLGEPDANALAGLQLCADSGRALGPGTTHHAGEPDLYLPLRGRDVALGAVTLRGLGTQALSPDHLAHAQALCDQMGLALQRRRVQDEARRAGELADLQSTRNALLAAISHDYRTPLATIMGSASALQTQGERLNAAQRQELAARIVDETARLVRLTDNTLQLARLGAPGVTLRCDWESAEELVGAALRRVRRRPDGERVKARVAGGLPLLWCDAALMSQLLDNLVDNALKYSPREAAVELVVRRAGDAVLLAVRDRGPGIEPAWRERVFDAFQRGDLAGFAQRPPGAGVGLAVCRAIAEVHEGSLSLRPRGHGGCSFEFRLPLRAAPELPEAGA
ncbi:sensor histidine kinase [Pelomonas aquatica]|jgi:two-component system sensor histidine kinase KdpD|uniref:histidine kinase n=1 Tax=Pelomonas aquatica TaxID=431058 RepID=A0A9X4R5Y4_9BURK|nr:ATP-binding protein [Pelomonas aquatica]MCY4757187.1 ATP-binding protein [Pelomonas aquatica]MDG0864927.1 two-component sensor histidine kinase [Pelomonas aquatica]